MNYNTYRDNWEKAKSGITPDIPLNIDIELTSRCNLKCVFCPHSSNFFDYGDMNPHMASKIINQVVDYGIPAIKFNLRGEPTLYPKLLDMVSLTSILSNNTVETIINTNGQCKYDILDTCMKLGLSKMIFSVDAVTEETYKKLRGGDFNRLVSNIIGISSKYPDRVICQFTESDINRDEKEQFIDKYKKLGIKTRVSICTDRGSTVGTQLHGKRKYCGQPSQRMAVLYNGDVIACCSDWECAYVIGNTYKDNLIDIWNGDGINALRKDLIIGKHNEYTQCAKCFCTESYCNN